MASVKDRASLSVENEGTHSSKPIAQTSTEQQHNADKDASSIWSSGTLANEVDIHNVDHVEVPVTVNIADTVTSTSNGELLNEKASDVPVEHPPSRLPAKEIEVGNEDHPIDGGQNIKLRDAKIASNIDQERSQSTISDSPVNIETPIKDADHKVEPLVNQKNQEEHKADTSPMNIQDQLDEVNYLL